jgi:hypothetical protein
MLTYQIDSSEFRNALRTFEASGKKAWPGILRQVGRLVAVNFAHSTQPYGATKAALKIGEAAVHRDLLGGKKKRGAFIPMSQGLLDNAVFYKSTENVRLFVTKGGRVYGTDRQHFKPDMTHQEMSRHHKSLRDSRGRTGTAGGRTRDIGRWKFLDQYVVNKRNLGSYVKKIKARVGFAKSAWATVARVLGGTRGIPSWVTRNNGPAQVIDRSSHPTVPSIIMRSNVSYASQVLPPAEVNKALRIQEQKFIQYVRHQLRAAATKARL